MKSTVPAVDRRVLLVALRVSVVGLVVVALLDLFAPHDDTAEQIVVAVDVSASVDVIDASTRAWMREQAGAIRVLPFAARPMPPIPASAFLDLPAGAPRQAGGIDDLPAQTDIERALRAAAAMLPDTTGTVVVISDGRETRGDARAAAAALKRRAEGLRLATMPASIPPDEVWIEDLDHPARVVSGDTVSLEARIRSTSSTTRRVRVDWLRDGVSIADGQVVTIPAAIDGVAGTMRVAAADRPPDVGRVRYALKVSVAEPRGADDPRNDRREALVDVGGRRRVLWLGRDAEPSSPDESVQLVALPLPLDDTALADVDAVVVDDVPAGARGIDPVTQQQLVEAVRDRGIGLITAGASGFYGPGGYSGSVLEAALPVICRPEDRRPRLLLVLFDTSGSMERERKLERASAAIRAIAAALDDGDSMALLTFADAARVALPPTTATALDGRLSDALAGIEARGETQLVPALEQALELVAGNAYEASMFLVTDGKAAGELSPFGERFAAEGVRVCVFLTGADAEEERLRALIRDSIGGSITRDVDARFLDTLLRDAWWEGDLAVDASAVIVTGEGPLAGALAVAAPSEIRAWARVTGRAGAAIGARARSDDAPLVASWRCGEGRVLSFLGAMSSWLPEAGPPDLLRAALEWVAPPPQSRWFESVEWGAAGIDVRVRVPDGSGTAVSEPLVVRWGERRVRLRAETVATACGEIEPPIDSASSLLVLERGGAEVDRIDIADRNSAEWTSYGVDLGMLRDIARLGGGELLEPGMPPAPRQVPAPAPFHGGWLLPAALVLLFLERLLSLRSPL